LWSPAFLDGPQDPELSVRPPPRPLPPPPILPAAARIADAGAPSDGADYALEGELGRGGMGQVFAARDRVLQRSIALKLMRPDLLADPQAAARFVDEALITGQLEHPNIVPVYDLGRTTDERLFMGMKRVRGEELKALLRREPATDPVRLQRYLEVLTRVADALSFAHSAGIVHRDLKPDN
ncbi:MAG: serine/threonine protein kinase, partial [Myxococcales bacterium]|nr:serine/threonine protein kinase [Myxococcales bacterium]